MSAEKLHQPHTSINDEYRKVRKEAGEKKDLRSEVILYDLANSNDHTKFIDSLKNFQLQVDTPFLQAKSDESLILEAMEKKVFVDNYDIHLEDKAKLLYPKGYFEGREKELEQYKKENDKWEDSVVAEYPWEQKRRYVRVPNEKDYYEVAFSRNNFIYSQETQEKIRHTKFGVVGLGVGSAIATVLVHSGAQNFRAADGGEVTLHDHNRLLGADVGESGINHAVHWARMAAKVNPYAVVDCIPQNVGEGANEYPLHKFIDGIDIVIEEADSLPVKVAMRDEAKKRSIPVFMGSDLGKDGLVHYEAPDSARSLFDGRLTDVVRAKLKDPAISFEEKTKVAFEVMIGGHNLSEEFTRSMEGAKAAGVPYWPQAASGAFASARGVFLAINDFFEGKQIPPERPMR